MFDGSAINMIREVQCICFPDERQSMLCYAGLQMFLTQSCLKIDITKNH